MYPPPPGACTACICWRHTGNNNHGNVALTNRSFFTSDLMAKKRWHSITPTEMAHCCLQGQKGEEGGEYANQEGAGRDYRLGPRAR